MHTSEEKFYTAVAIGATILGVIIVYFIVTMIRHQRRNLRLYKTRIHAEISTLENERQRIASDLHDELGPLLSAVRMQISHIDAQGEQDISLVQSATRHIDDILTHARAISYNLLPNTLVKKGLIKAVEEYISKLRDVHDLDMVLNAEGNFQLGREQEINIYRMIQEITHNTIKHAKATQLIIQLRKYAQQMVLITADNGTGFSYDDEAKDPSGLGLSNLQSRADVLNATFTCLSKPGQGTQYIFEIPYVYRDGNR